MSVCRMDKIVVNMKFITVGRSLLKRLAEHVKTNTIFLRENCKLYSFLLMTRAHHDSFYVSAYKENYIPGVKTSKP
jgi:hypothetical protein